MRIDNFILKSLVYSAHIFLPTIHQSKTVLNHGFDSYSGVLVIKSCIRRFR